MLTANRSKRLDDAKHNITVAQKRQKEQYDRKHSGPQNFEIGTKVLLTFFGEKGRVELWVTNGLGPMRL